MLTPFGQACRQVRNSKGLRLLDIAKALGKSSAFISAIETGRKPIPQGFELNLIDVMELDQSEAAEIQSSADKTRKEVPVSVLKEDQRELVAAFARNVKGFSEAEISEFRKQIFKARLKSIDSDAPFYRRRGILVSPRSMMHIWNHAELVRSVFTEPEEIAFPIVEILESKLDLISKGSYLDVRSEKYMGEDEGRAIPEANKIEIRNDVYESACNHMGRARFTLAHELGHFLMHREVSYARMKPSDEYPIYRDSEWQADTFAGALLMSSTHLPQFQDAGDAAVKCKITGGAADVMWDKYKNKGKLK